MFRLLLLSILLTLHECISVIKDDSRDNLNYEDSNNLSKCYDLNRNCKSRAANGECYRNPRLMMEECKLSCDSCDLNQVEEGIKHYGVAQDIRGDEKYFSFQTMKLSLNYMKQLKDNISKEKWHRCRNEHKLCSFWAGMGHCESNAEFMEKNCAPSCRNCENITETENEVFDDVILLERIKEYGISQEAVGREKQDTLKVIQESLKYMKYLHDTYPNVDVSFCENRNERCAFWAATGYCQMSYMQQNCSPSCETCHKIIHPLELELIGETGRYGVKQEVRGSEKGKTLDKIKASLDYVKKLEDMYTEDIISKCTNKHKLCSFWAVMGECEKNPAAMNSNCILSCQSCHVVLQEIEIALSENIKRHGIEQKIFNEKKSSTLDVIRSTLEYMNKLEASMTEDKLRQCRNKDEMCAFWASTGKCVTNAIEMTKICAPCCHSCHLEDSIETSLSDEILPSIEGKESSDEHNEIKEGMAKKESIIKPSSQCTKSLDHSIAVNLFCIENENNCVALENIRDSNTSAR